MQQLIEVNGTKLSVSERGSGAPLIFIHGFPFSKQMWQPQVEELSAHFRVITFDLRGFGDSPPSKGELSMDIFASDLLGLLDAMEIAAASVCGISMGGYILMNAVARAPRRFTSIILADTQCIADSAETRQKRMESIEAIRANGMDAYAESFVKNIFSKKALNEGHPGVAAMREIIASNSSETVVAGLKALAARRESCNALKTADVPALVICGKEDTVTPLSQAELLFSTLPNAELQEIEAGHLSNIENPVAFNGHLLAFLQKTNPSKSG